MRSVMISQNPDMLTGMRLSGIAGALVTNRDDFLERLRAFLSDPKVGIIILTRDVMSLAENEVMEMKLESKEKLIVEIPDFGGVMEDRMSRYIRESIGIKID